MQKPAQVSPPRDILQDLEGLVDVQSMFSMLHSQEPAQILRLQSVLKFLIDQTQQMIQNHPQMKQMT